MDNNQFEKKNQFENTNNDSIKENSGSPQQPIDNNQVSNLQPEELPPDLSEIPLPSQDSLPISNNISNNYSIFFIGGGIALIIFLSIIFVFLFGKKSNNKEVLLTYWGLWEEEEVMKPLIDDYQRKNKNIKIVYEKKSIQDYREKLIARINDGRGPDIFRFHNTWLPEIRQIVAPAPEAIISSLEFEKKFYPIFSNDLKVGKFYYGIPLYIDGLVLIYNKNLFNKAGIEIVPSNWDELLDVASRLTVKDQEGRIITSGIALGTANNIEHFSDILGLFLLQNGADLKKLDSLVAIDALKAYRKFAEPPNNFWDETMPNSITAFIQEKVAMILAPTWEILVIKAANPEIDLRTAPAPVVPGSKLISIANYWTEGVSIKSKNQLEAWKFIKYLVEKENLSKLYANQAKVRLFGNPYPRRDMADLLIKNNFLSGIINEGKNLKSLPLISRTFDNGLNDEIIKYLENAINSTIEGVSYEEAMRKAKEGVIQVLSKFEL